MKTLVHAATALLALAAAAPAAASVAPVSVPMRHVQAILGTPDNLYVKTHGNWYRAAMAQPCRSLDPDTNRVRIALGPDGRFDDTSTVIVHRQSCPVASVTRDQPPLDLVLNPNG
jgi:hypothetical protein